MSSALPYMHEREADLERRHAKVEREQARREARHAKRSGVVVSDLRALDALVDRAGTAGVIEAQRPLAARENHEGGPESITPPTDPLPMPTTQPKVAAAGIGAEAASFPTRPQTFAERRQQLADRARDRATAAVAEEADRQGERRRAEREVARRALQTLSLEARATQARQAIELAIAADDPVAVRSAARRALWSAAGDAALRAEVDSEEDLSLCPALAVIEWLPISAIRVGRRARSAVGVPASGTDPAFTHRTMAATTDKGGGEEMELQEANGAVAFVVRLRDRCEPRLTGGYEGCELAVPVASRELAQALVGALLERDHTEQLAAGMYAKPLAGGTRTVVMEPSR